MKTTKLLYRDTMNYSPIDVIKGIDLVTKQIVMADDPAPDGYKVKPKCKFCKNFLTQDEAGYLGTCGASKTKFIAYADMISTTCKDYERTNI